MGVYSKTTEHVQSYEAARDLTNKFRACLKKKIPPPDNVVDALGLKVQLFPDGSFLISSVEHTLHSIFYDTNTDKTYKLFNNIFGIVGWTKVTCDEEDVEKSWKVFQQRIALYRLMGITV